MLEQRSMRLSNNLAELTVNPVTFVVPECVARSEGARSSCLSLDKLRKMMMR